ncbi:MAG: PEGA domain-containing protein [Myxococcales bacterium]
MAPRSDEKQPPAPAPSFEIGHDGKIDGIYRGRDSRRQWTPTDDARLELAEQAPRRDAQLPEPPPMVRRGRSSWGIAIAIGLAVAALLSPFAVRWAMRWQGERELRASKAAGLIFIDSVPSGAQVFIDGVEVGRTPYVAPNRFQPGSTIPARIVYPGAQEWTGTFPGGVATSFTAELQAK